METESSGPDRLFRAFTKSGDPRALGEVYDRLAPELLRIALHTARDAAEAEDVLQATFVAAIERARHFDPAQRVLPWLVGILANEARKARERATRRPDPERLERRTSTDPEIDAERAELLALLDGALERVPEAYRPVLQLRLRHGLSVTEIATALGRPSGTVRSQLARGTEYVRRSLPAGLAGALALVATPTRGLAAVRDAVLERASVLHAPLTISTAIGGLLAVKKLSALAAVLLAAVCWWSVSRQERVPAQPDAEIARAAPLLQAALRAHVPAEPQAEAVPGSQRESMTTEPALKGLEPVAAGGGLAVHARWPDGTPAAGEIVLVTPLRSRSDEALTLATEKDGAARFRGLEPGSVRVRLLRGGETMARVSARRDVAVTLDISAGVTVDGRVRDALGEPVPGAEIWVSERYLNNLGHVVAHSDERGEFTLRAFGPDHYLGAKKRGFAPSGLRSLRGANGDRLGLELVLAESGAAVRGQVFDANGQVIPGARVLLGTERPPSVRLEDGSFAPAAPPQRGQAGADGRFELATAALGLQPLQVRASGFAPLETTLEVQAAGPNECRVTLEREARLVGVVRDPEGRPIPGAWIHTLEPELFGSSSAMAGLDGRFELAGLGRGHARARAENAEHGAAERELHLLPGETLEWQVVLAPTARIEGRIVDARGAPLAGLVVIALANRDRELRTRSDASDSAGRFAVNGLGECAHILWVQSPLGWRDFPLAEVEDAWPGGAPLELRVPDACERGRLTLAVTTPDGSPLAGAELQVWHVERRMWRSFVSQGEEGMVLAQNVPPGTLELELRHPEHPWKPLGEQRIEAGATLDLGSVALEPSGSLRVRLSGLQGELYGGLTAALTNASNRESAVARLTPGLLSAGPLACGEHRLLLGGDGVRQVRRSFRIEPGVETELGLVLEPCALREVVFSLPGGAARPKWISCTLHDTDGMLVWGGHADVTREPFLARVSAPPGTYRLVVAGEGGFAAETELRIAGRAAAEAPFELDLQRRP